MKKQTWLIFVVTVLLCASAAVLLLRLQTGQKLGKPGVKTAPIEGSNRLQVVLPEHVLDYKSEMLETDEIVINTLPADTSYEGVDYKSEMLETDEIVINTLPADTSYGQARYTAKDGFVALLNVVLMGRDRTSLHKPQFCLAGMGWSIDNLASSEDKVRIESPAPYDLPVVKLISNKQLQHNGQTFNAKGIYVYWFVADDAISASVSGFERMWWMGVHLFRTGELQRWAYVSCFSVCEPGQEEATYARMKEFIASAVPQFQKKPGDAAAFARASAP